MSYQAPAPSNKITVSVFNNQRKSQENSPDFSGEVAFPDGRKMEIALWNAQSKSGLSYMRGHIGEKFQPQGGNGGGSGYAPRAQQDAVYQAPANSVKIDF